MKIKIFIGAAIALLPAIALAQFGPINTFFYDIMFFINNVLIPLVFSVALLVFLYGAFKHFIQHGDSEEAQKKGRQLMVYAIVGFVLMVSIWGIVNLLARGLFGYSQQPPPLPGIPGSYSGTTNTGSTPAPANTPGSLGGLNYGG